MNNLNKNIDYWVACSGGVDSVVLVRLFKMLNKNIGILHCNFKLRGEASEKDEGFVRNLASEMNVPIEVRVFDIHEYIQEKGGNTQLAARNLRYQWFEEVQRDSNAQIALGHHKDDQIETFFLQLRRGGKLKGLSCMTISHKGFIRPLLNYSKDEIYSLARKNNWLWREDESNQNSDYLRNFYRNELIPVIKNSSDILPVVLELIDDFQRVLLFTDQYLNHQFNFCKIIEVSFNDWDVWPFWMKHLLISKSELSPLSVREVDRLRFSNKGKFLKNGFKSIWNEGVSFVIKSIHSADLNSEYQIELCNISEVEFRNGVVFIDKEKVNGMVTFRAWRDGDIFQPLGMKGQKKVAKFLRDKKVLSSEKNRYPVLVDESDRILGVAGICPDERFKIDTDSKWLYRIIKA